MQRPDQINTPNLGIQERTQLVLSIATVLVDNGTVSVALTYDKQTDTRARVAGKDYVALPGVQAKSLIGTLMVFRYADNRANRKLGRVGNIYLKVESVTRADGTKPVGYANIRPEGITAFQITGFVPKQPQAAQTPAEAGA